MKRSAALELVQPASTDDAARPHTRADCQRVPRPCPHVSCRFHLVDIEVRADQLISIGDRHLAPDASETEIETFVDDVMEDISKLPESCSLDAIARHGSMTLQLIAERMRVTRERIRQVESKALRAFDKRMRWLGRGVQFDSPPIQPRDRLGGLGDL